MFSEKYKSEIKEMILLRLALMIAYGRKDGVPNSWIEVTGAELEKYGPAVSAIASSKKKGFFRVKLYGRKRALRSFCDLGGTDPATVLKAVGLSDPSPLQSRKTNSRKNDEP